MTGSNSKTSRACVGSVISLPGSCGAQSIGSGHRSPSASALSAINGLAARNFSKLRRSAANDMVPLSPTATGSLRLEITGLRRGQWREFAAVGLDIQSRRLVEAIEAAHQHDVAFDNYQ